MATPQYVALGKAEAEAFDTYKAEQAQCRELDRRRRTHERPMKEAKELLLQAFDGCSQARLPDGRIITRTENPRHRRAQPASDYVIIDFEEAGTLRAANHSCHESFATRTISGSSPAP